MSTTPTGQERQVKLLGGAAIDGAPIAYIVVLAAVVTVLAFIPFSVVLAQGGSFPMSQGVYGLVGWILGPVAGAIASGIGTLIAVFLAPHTAGVPAVSVWGGIVASFTAGLMALGEKRRVWRIALIGLFIVGWLVLVGRAVLVNGVGLPLMLGATWLIWSAIILYALPQTRNLLASWIGNKNLGLVAVGLFVSTWLVGALMLGVQSPITYWMFNWPEEVWIALIPIVPVENLFRSLIGTVIGVGVIAGLRAIGLVKPTEAIY